MIYHLPYRDILYIKTFYLVINELHLQIMKLVEHFMTVAKCKHILIVIKDEKYGYHNFGIFAKNI